MKPATRAASLRISAASHAADTARTSSSAVIIASVVTELTHGTVAGGDYRVPAARSAHQPGPAGELEGEALFRVVEVDVQQRGDLAQAVGDRLRVDVEVLGLLG